jgi:hypothetical protein
MDEVRSAKEAKVKIREGRQSHREANGVYNAKHTTWSVLKSQDERLKSYQKSLPHLRNYSRLDMLDHIMTLACIPTIASHAPPSSRSKLSDSSHENSHAEQLYIPSQSLRPLDTNSDDSEDDPMDT